MRARRPTLIGRTAQTVARTAVIAGTATAVSGAAGRRRDVSDRQPESSAAEPAGLSHDAMEQLKKLSELRTAGVLTDEEFAIQKARILGP